MEHLRQKANLKVLSQVLGMLYLELLVMVDTKAMICDSQYLGPFWSHRLMTKNLHILALSHQTPEWP